MPFNPKWIVGRRIVGCSMRTWNPGEHFSRGTLNHDPIITLDNGAALTFIAEEAEDDYGVNIIYHPATRRGAK